MEKEYVTARLFKNNRAENDQITNQELPVSDQEQLADTLNSQENNKPLESSANSNQPSLPQRFLTVIQKALTVLGLDRKG